MESLATLSEVKNFFGYSTSKEFKDDWVQLEKKDQEEIRRLVTQG